MGEYALSRLRRARRGFWLFLPSFPQGSRFWIELPASGSNCLRRFFDALAWCSFLRLVFGGPAASFFGFGFWIRFCISGTRSPER